MSDYINIQLNSISDKAKKLLTNKLTPSVNHIRVVEFELDGKLRYTWAIVARNGRILFATNDTKSSLQALYRNIDTVLGVFGKSLNDIDLYMESDGNVYPLKGECYINACKFLYNCVKLMHEHGITAEGIQDNIGLGWNMVLQILKDIENKREKKNDMGD